MSGLTTNPGAIWLAVAPVDMRRGIDGLSMLVQQVLGKAPGSGAAFVFRNRLGNRIKVLVWDGTGVWLCQRRLHEGCFVWPKASDPCFSVTFEQSPKRGGDPGSGWLPGSIGNACPSFFLRIYKCKWMPDLFVKASNNKAFTAFYGIISA